MAQALSIELQARARKNERVIVNKLFAVGQDNLADLLGLHESTISKRKADKYFESMAETLAALGLKAVPVEAKCYKPEEIIPYIQIAQQHLKRVKSLQDILDDDAEDEL